MIKGFSIIFILVCFLVFLLVVIGGFLLIKQNYYDSSLATIINTDLDKNNNLYNLIQVTTPQNDEVISSPLLIKGQARGNWFFEASFPVKLVGNQGQELAHGIAQAQSDWMTENFVPFIATLTFTQPTATSGTLILQKDNPSGLPEHDAQINIPILFEQERKVTAEPCLITGCSKQICADEEVVTTCDFKPQYVCYTKATCGRQVDGRCGWTQTTDLKTCLAGFN